MELLSESVTRLHALVHNMAEAVAETLASAAVPPAAAADAADAADFSAANASTALFYSATSSTATFPSPSDVRCCSQQLQHQLQDMIMFISLAHCYCSRGASAALSPGFVCRVTFRCSAAFADRLFALQSLQRAAATTHLDDGVWGTPPMQIFGGGISSTASAVTTVAAAAASAAASAAAAAAAATANAMTTAMHSETIAAGISSVGSGVTGQLFPHQLETLHCLIKFSTNSCFMTHIQFNLQRWQAA
jgi:hypothetical protein